MYGTVARYRLNPGAEAKMAELMASEETNSISGIVSVSVYRLDSGNDEYIMSVVFESKEAYWKNAESQEQNARFQEMRALMAADPLWMDGEVIHHS